MPVARIITQYPQESEELRRQLEAAGYTVKFAAPGDEFDPGDLVVAAANIHTDYALQYASEVAQESGADVIVAPGVVAGSPAIEEPSLAPVVAETSAGIGEKLGSIAGSLRSRWQEFRSGRELAREQNRLEAERRALDAEERSREALRMRAAEEARISVERERLRLQRLAEEEKLRRAAEVERARAAEDAARLAAEREQLRLQRQAEEEKRQLAEMERAHAAEMDAARAAELERSRIAAERERPRIAEERERMRPVYIPPVAPPLAEVPVGTVPRPAVGSPRRAAAASRLPRQRRMQRAVLIASVVALLVMIGFAVALNMNSHVPLPNGMVNSTVQEESPFGPAHVSPVQTSAPKPVPRATAPAAQPRPVPQSANAQKPPAAIPAEHHPRSRRRAGDDVAQDQVVIIHHYAPVKKHPQGAQSAGIPKYSDEH
jgi:hypothetical protein